MKPEIKLDKTRSKLCEGRSSGIGHAFLKKVGDNKFEAVQPISPCKDYMNDVVYSELTGKPFQAWGLSTKKQDIFVGGKAYVATASTTNCKSDEKGIEFEAKALKDNLENITKAMNGIEEMLGVKDKTKLIFIEENLVFAEISDQWVTSTWACSLWGTIFRSVLTSAGDEPLKEMEKTKVACDQQRMPDIINKINHWAKNGFPKQDFSKSVFWHDEGIVSHKLAKA